MGNTYKPISVVGEHHFGSEPFEADFDAATEADWLNGGHVVQVPRTYRVLSDNYTAGKQGEQVELALLVDVEQALIAGGHLQRVEPTPVKPAARKKQE